MDTAVCKKAETKKKDQKVYVTVSIVITLSQHWILPKNLNYCALPASSKCSLLPCSNPNVCRCLAIVLHQIAVNFWGALPCCKCFHLARHDWEVLSQRWNFPRCVAALLHEKPQVAKQVMVCHQCSKMEVVTLSVHETVLDTKTLASVPLSSLAW